MTADAFRRIALSIPDAIEAEHMGHPDFRLGGKIFATLSADGTKGMVKLTLEQQDNYCRAAPESIQPVPGGWGRQGATFVLLKAAKAPLVRQAMAEAAANVRKPPAKRGTGAKK